MRAIIFLHRADFFLLSMTLHMEKSGKKIEGAATHLDHAAKVIKRIPL